MLPSRDIHKFKGIPPDGKTHDNIDHILLDGRRHSRVPNAQNFIVASCDIGHNLMMTNLGRERQDLQESQSLHGQVESQENIQGRE
jgi:hypothetical protein